MQKLNNPRRRHELQPRHLGPVAILVCVVLAGFAAVAKDFNYTQDIAAYVENLKKYSQLNEITQNEYKSLWYRVIVLPLFSRVQDAKATLEILKAASLALFIVAMRRSLVTYLDAAIVVACLLFAPVLSDNFNEYLRQGMAVGVCLCAMSARNRLVALVLAALALAMHVSVAIYLVAAFLGHGLQRLLFRRGKEWHQYVAIACLVAVIAAPALGILLAPSISKFAPAAMSPFLQGKRHNILGIVYLGGYSAYILAMALRSRSGPHCAAFIAVLAVGLSYSVILDFGRAIALIMPLHLRASVTLEKFHQRAMDIAVLAIFGLPLTFFATFAQAR